MFRAEGIYSQTVYNNTMAGGNTDSDRRFTMKYTEKERLEIGRRIYCGDMTVDDAAKEYDINPGTAKQYAVKYRDANGLPARKKGPAKRRPYRGSKEPATKEELESMTREELIREVLMARIREARLKKGYEVKGDGSVIVYGSKNTK